MDVGELYDFILNNMTAEQALKMMLRTSVDKYEALQLNEEQKAEGGSPLFIITAAALDLGFDLLIPAGADDNEVTGLIIGTKDYINSIKDKI